MSLNSTGQALVEKHNTSFNLFSAILIFTFNPDQQNWGIIIKQSLKDFTVSSEKSPRLRLLLNLETLKLLPYMAAKIHKKFMCDLVQVCNSHTKRKLNLIKTYQENIPFGQKSTLNKVKVTKTGTTRKSSVEGIIMYDLKDLAQTM